ncbi:Valine--tRNA ligase [subsurface metagenome]
MSKSKGNIIEPRDAIQKYGSDALRFWAAGSKLGEDLNYQEKDLVAGKRFVTKLFNASKFVFMCVGKSKPKKPKKLEKLDEAFLERLQMVVNSVTANFENYEYSKSKQEIERFFWKGFCDDYLEIVKKRVYNGKGNEKLSAKYTLYQSLLTILKLIAPIMPFITEEIYQKYFRKNEKNKGIHLCKWPSLRKINPKKYQLFALIQAIIYKVRKEKSSAQKSMNSKIILGINKRDKNLLKNSLEDLKNVTGAEEIKESKLNVEIIKFLT